MSITFRTSKTGDIYRLVGVDNRNLSMSRNEVEPDRGWYYLGYIPIDGNRVFIAVYGKTSNFLASASESRDISEAPEKLKEVDFQLLESEIVKEEPGPYTTKPLTYDERQKLNKSFLRGHLASQVKSHALDTMIELGLNPFKAGPLSFRE